MSVSSLIKKLLKIKDMVVQDARFEPGSDGEQLIIKAKLPAKMKHRCPICGKKAKRYDAGRGRRRWRSLDGGTTKIFIEADAPRVYCKQHGILTEWVSWARHDARFTYDFENTVAWLTLHSPISVVAECMRIAWNTVGPLVKRVHDEIKNQKASQYDGLTCIGIDETSYKKGHKYMTVVVNHDRGNLLWAAKGHGKTVLEEFFKVLSEEQRQSIKHVTADGARWIAECVSEWCPNAERSIGPFHVVQWATDTLDEVRRTVWREAREDAKAGNEKRKRGRPRTGEEAPSEKKADAVKGVRYPLAKNPENLTDGQAAAIEMIAKSNPRLYRAYLLKEKLRLLFHHSFYGAKAELERWISWARRCRIAPFVELQKKISRHFNAILSTIKHGLSNAKIEAVNNKIKLTVRMGYGFRNIDNLIALIMLRCSDVNLMLPGRA